MNLPNKLTTLRMILVPVFIIVYLTGYHYVSAVIFIAASLTDFLDGHLARKYDLVTISERSWILWRTSFW